MATDCSSRSKEIWQICGQETSYRCQEVRSELLDNDLDVQFISEDTSIDDDYNKELEEPSIKSLAEALRITDQLRDFAQFNGYRDLALARKERQMMWSRHYKSVPQNSRQHWQIILNKSSMKYLELNFFTY